MEYAAAAAAAINPLAAGGAAAGLAGVYGAKKAYNYFVGKAKTQYGSSWANQMNRNQINRLANESIHKTQKRRPKGCTVYRKGKKKYYKKRRRATKSKAKRKSKKSRKRKPRR